MSAAPWRHATKAPAVRWLAAGQIVAMFARLCVASRSVAHLRLVDQMHRRDYSRHQVADQQYGANRPPVILFSALHKAGSMALAEMQWDACYMANATIVSNNRPPPRFQDNKAARFHYYDEQLGNILRPEYMSRAAALGQAVCVGPIRDHSSHEHLTTSNDVVHVFLMRHPLDMLVSAYFSFGWSHHDDGSPEFAALRTFVRSLTVDEYALNRTSHVRHDYGKMQDALAKTCKNQPRYRCIVLSYEMMMSAPQVFASRLAAAFDYKPKMVPIIADALAAKHVPKAAVILAAAQESKTHVRSGVPGNYKAHLSKETVARLESTFADVIALIDKVAAGVHLTNLYDLPQPTNWD